MPTPRCPHSILEAVANHYFYKRLPPKGVDAMDVKQAESELALWVRSRKEVVPVLDDKSTFGDTFEFWNISGRNQALDEVAKSMEEEA